MRHAPLPEFLKRVGIPLAGMSLVATSGCGVKDADEDFLGTWNLVSQTYTYGNASYNYSVPYASLSDFRGTSDPRLPFPSSENPALAAQGLVIDEGQGPGECERHDLGQRACRASRSPAIQTKCLPLSAGSAHHLQRIASADAAPTWRLGPSRFADLLLARYTLKKL